MAKTNGSAVKQKPGNGHFDINKMADIIITLVQKYQDDKLVTGMIGHLIRDESDYIAPGKKSAGAAALEQEYFSLKGLTRNDIYSKSRALSKKIIIEHGFPINAAIEECTKAKDNKAVAAILKRIKNSLIFITKDEDKKLAKGGFSKNKKDGFEAAYAECGIKLVANN